MPSRRPPAPLAALVLAAAILAAPSSARADDVVIEETPRGEYEKRTALSFTEVDVVGTLTRPAGDFVVARKKTRFKNLIALRASFRRELLDSASSP